MDDGLFLMTSYRLIVKDRLREQEIIACIKTLCEERHFPVTFDVLQSYIITTRQNTFIINTDEIVYLYREGKNVCFVLSSGKTIQERRSLKEVAGQLDDDRFIMIERGYVINLSHVRQVCRDSVLMDNDTTLGIARTRKRGVMDKLHSFMDISPTV